MGQPYFQIRELVRQHRIGVLWKNPNQSRYDAINQLLASGSSWSQVQNVIGCSRSTISRAVIQLKSRKPAVAPEPEQRIAVILWAPVFNGNKFTRGKKKVKEEIVWLVEADFDGEVLDDNEYRLFLTCGDEDDLKEQVDDLLSEIRVLADGRNCIVDDMALKNESTGQYWDDYDNEWKSP